MPADMYTINRTKELILAFIRARGPSLPVHIARDVKSSPLFTAAFLSELYNDGKIKMSAMKIGSSSLYYLSDQVSQLENFIEHLNSREKEAFLLLKEKKILDDEKLTPVERVALRTIKDFAIPLDINAENRTRLVWRYFLLTEAEAHEMIDKSQEEKEQKPVVTASSKRPDIEKPKIERKKEAPEIYLELALVPTDQQKSLVISEFPFLEKIKKHLAQRNISLMTLISVKKKEVIADIQSEGLFGKQERLLVAKEKKRIKAEELIETLKQAHGKKMPALFLAPGEVEKKALPVLQEWRNFIKFERLT